MKNLERKNHTSHITLHTSQKGITLIALIITIIVMLILVGVTINVALNGGLFQKADDAAVETEKKAILEQIIALSEWDNNGKINIKATVDNVIEEFGADKASTNPSSITESTTEARVTVSGKHGQYNYKVTTREIKLDEGNGPEPEPYYFTFNMIEEIFEEAEERNIMYQVINETNGTSMSILAVNNEEFWSKVGTNLSGLYGVSTDENAMFTLIGKTISSGDTSAFSEYYNGAESSTSDILFMFMDTGDMIGIYLIKNPGEELDFDNGSNVYGLVSEEGDATNEVLSWTEFLYEYGEIKFYFDETINELEGPDTDYYGYYSAGDIFGGGIPTGFYIVDQNYYLGDLAQIYEGEYTKTGYGYDWEECSVAFGLALGNKFTPNQYGYIVDEYTAVLEDGTSKTYEDAIIGIAKDGYKYLVGYLKYENDKYKLNSIRAEFSKEESNIDNERKIIKYVSLTENEGVQKSFLPINSDKFDAVYEYDTGEGFSYLIAKKKGSNGCSYGINILGQDWIVSRETFTISAANVEFQFEDGTVEKFEKVLKENSSIVGYFEDDNTIIRIDRIYNSNGVVYKKMHNYNKR